MSYWDIKPKTIDARIGQRIYEEALYDRKGFHESLDDIDDDIWQEIFYEMGRVAIDACNKEFK